MWRPIAGKPTFNLKVPYIRKALYPSCSPYPRVTHSMARAQTLTAEGRKSVFFPGGGTCLAKVPFLLPSWLVNIHPPTHSLTHAHAAFERIPGFSGGASSVGVLRLQFRSLASLFKSTLKGTFSSSTHEAHSLVGLILDVVVAYRPRGVVLPLKETTLSARRWAGQPKRGRERSE